MAKAPLYIVATPIGNLEDISQRALRVLSEVDLVAAEDTRHSSGLLARHGLQCRLFALHEHNEEKQAPQLVQRMLAGESMALISDAGTPLISDPGFRLISLAVEKGVEVIAVPGPSAVIAALSVSGLPTDRFVFEGFLPAKNAARVKLLMALELEPRTLVFYESSHRIEDTLADMQQAFGAERPMALCRELTKQFETVLRGSVAMVRQQVQADPNQRKGEFVVVVAGNPGDASVAMTAALQLARELQDHVGASQAARIAARIHHVARRDIYTQLGH